MFGFLKKKPIDPEVKKAYDAAYKAKIEECKAENRTKLIEKAKEKAAQKALSDSQTGSNKVLGGLTQVGRGLNQASAAMKKLGDHVDNEKLDAFVLGDKKPRQTTEDIEKFVKRVK